MKSVALSLVLLFGCQEPTKRQPPPAPGSSSAAPAAAPRRDACAAALKTFDQFVDTGEPDAPADQRAKVKAAVLDRCVADNWSEPALACMRAAGTSHDVFKCWNDQLTKAQREAASAALGSLSQ